MAFDFVNFFFISVSTFRIFIMLKAGFFLNICKFFFAKYLILKWRRKPRIRWTNDVYGHGKQ